MKTDIILAGVGGQGILSIAAVIGQAALENNLNMKQAEVHGMSQRGGAVQSNLRISDKPIFSDLIPKGKADLIISLEPMEALRYLPYLSKDGWIITNNTPLVNIPNYPDLDQVLNTISQIPNHVLLDVDHLAKKLGSARVSNILMLGAAAPFMEIPPSFFENGIHSIFGRKGEEIVNLNLKALQVGIEIAKKRVMSKTPC